MAHARCVIFALACALCLFLWQALTVRYSYSGSWTGLFCIGALYGTPPPALASEELYVFPDSVGYDGQAYHYIAHDPFFRRGFARSIDAPRFRYRRILVPGLAFLLAGGEDRAVDAAYMGVVLGFVLLGAYWLGRFGVLLGYGPWLGLWFALVPAVLVSIDRLTVDVALAACCAGFALYVREWRPWKLYAVLVAAALARETGLLLIAACVLWLLVGRRFREALLFSTAALPAVCWYVFVSLHTTPEPFEYLTPVLFSGIVGRVLHPAAVAASSGIRVLAFVLDLLALAGVAGALLWAFLRALRRALTPVAIAIYLFALLATVLAPGDAWSDVYSFGRTLTPLLLLCALDGLAGGSRWPALAMLLVDARIGLLMGGQILNVLRGVAALR
ncbi:MAG: hypothetical protein ABSH47_20140 [Bryobacteraceae bacterium]